MAMNTRNSTQCWIGYVLWSLALAVVIIGEVEDLVHASAEGFSAWDWVLAVCLVVLLVSIGSGVTRWLRNR